MNPFNSIVLLAFVLVTGVALFIAAKSRTRRIQAERPREVSPKQKSEKDEELRLLLESGKKIEAIKIYREFYRVGLKEAKDAVELLAAKRA